MTKKSHMIAGCKRLLIMAAWLTLASGCGKTDPWQTKIGCINNGVPMGSTLITGANLPDNSLVMTFDGGPSDFTAQIGEYLWQNGIAGTFFIAGRQVARHDQRLERLKAIGHLVGNLSFDGRALPDSPDPIQAIRRTDELITPYVTGNMFLLRPPMGVFDDDLAAKMDHAGMRKYVGPIGWDVGSTNAPAPPAPLDLDCWQAGQDPDGCATRYMQNIRTQRKGIIVIHDSEADSPALVKKIITLASSESYGFIRLDAIPQIKEMIDSNGGTYDKHGGDAACNDYN